MHLQLAGRLFSRARVEMVRADEPTDPVDRESRKTTTLRLA